MSYEFLVISGFFLTVFTFYTFRPVEKRTKQLAELNIIESPKLITIRKFKLLFAYPMRGGNVITKSVHSYMVLFYVVNIAAAVLFVIYFVIQAELLLIASFFLLISNLIITHQTLFVFYLTPEQNRIVDKDNQRRKDQMKEQKQT